MNKGKRRQKIIRLYRAVSEVEFADLMQTGRFRSKAGALEGKWFAESVESAAAWGQWFSAVSGVAHDRIVEVELEADVADRFFRIDSLDGKGAARFAEISDLDGIVAREAR